MGAESGRVTLCLAGDVMTGRGIDQILPHPNDPVLFEPFVRRATEYVRMAERRSGPIPRPVDDAYVWGELLPVMHAADVRIVNLETAVTTSPTPYPKGINYRMHPDHVGVLRAARIDVCALANNHVLDWGEAGLLETLDVLHAAGVATAGAGRDDEEAARPAAVDLPGGGRVRVHAVGHGSSGVPCDWAAARGKPGVARLDGLTPEVARALAARIAQDRQPEDLVVVSVHWGGNWGWRIPDAHRRFARALVAEGGVDLIHGHSSHHPLGIEIIDGVPVLYGCGDLVNDYEGIGGEEIHRPDLGLLHLATWDPAERRWTRMELVPLKRERFRLVHARGGERGWLAHAMARACGRLGVRVVDAGGRLGVVLPGSLVG